MTTTQSRKALQRMHQMVEVFYCHECKLWAPTERDAHGRYTCTDCGEDIVCDECGDRWRDDHTCEGQGSR